MSVIQPDERDGPPLEELVEELVDFSMEHPTRPLDRQTTQWLIERIGLAERRLFDLAGPAGRRLLAVLFAEMDNPMDAAELWILGYRDVATDPDALDQAVAWAERAARAAGASQLELSLPAALRQLLPRLEGLGFGRAYDHLTMELDPIDPAALVQAQPPRGLAWADLSESNAAAAHACYAAAFATVSGAQIPTLDFFRATLVTATPRPRVLLAGRRVIAFVRAVLLDLTDGGGEIRSLARHPAARGQGLGTLALGEGLRRLVERGATSAFLDVASDNAAAIGLYERWDFTVRDRTPIVRRPLGP